MSSGAPLRSDAVRNFVTAGSAVFTLRSLKTGTHFTYRVTRSTIEDGRPPVWFVSVLTAPETYSYLGIIRSRRVLGELSATDFVRTAKSAIGDDAPSRRAFAWFWERVDRFPIPELEVWHCGTCGRCGRELTVPESIATGLGPVCAGRSS